jgi:transcriptional regulator with XRE-family HTH domain
MTSRKTDPVHALARNVRERREALGMSQEELARAAQINAAALSRIENGLGCDRGVGLSRITRIAKALKVSASALLVP